MNKGFMLGETSAIGHGSVTWSFCFLWSFLFGPLMKVVAMVLEAAHNFLTGNEIFSNTMPSFGCQCIVAWRIERSYCWGRRLWCLCGRVMRVLSYKCRCGSRIFGYLLPQYTDDICSFVTYIYRSCTSFFCVELDHIWRGVPVVELQTEAHFLLRSSVDRWFDLKGEGLVV